MCRLFGVIAREPLNPSAYLLEAPQSLLVQSDFDKKRLQGDGWGIGWFENGKPQIFKSPEPLFKDQDRLKQAAANAQGDLLVGHVRWASNPMKLPRNELIGLPHTQPFQHEHWLFVHNGTLYIPREVKAKLGEWEKFVQGRNDSEVLFYWLLKSVVHEAQGSWVDRMKASIQGLHQIWQGCKMQYPIYKDPYHGLNWVLTNGQVFLAFCYVDSHGIGKTKALCSPAQPYYELQMKVSDSQVTVASEPLDTGPGWSPLGCGRLMVAERKGQSISTNSFQVMPCS